MRAIKVAAILILVVLAAAVLFGWYEIRRGFSAHGTPSSVETLAARTTRALALPPDYKRLHNPYPPTAENIRAGMEHFSDHCATCHANVLQDQSWMPGPTELAEKFDPITTDWTYIRWLGDRKGIEEITKTWNKTVVDRAEQLRSWVDFCDQTTKRGITVYAYANNHYAGFGPATIELFRDLWYAKGLPGIARPQRMRQESSLFDL